MSRYEYLRRRSRRRNLQRRILVWQIALIAVIVFVISYTGFRIYSEVKEYQSVSADDQDPNGGVQAVASEPAVSAEAVTADVHPQEPTQEVSQEPTAAPREKAVALTFDDGPSRENTGKILDVLKSCGAHATFFVLGNRARVDGDILQMELEAGCEIASHSWDHPQLNKISWSKVKDQIQKTDNIVKKLTNGYEIQYLRPPYGAISDTMRKRMKKPMILWSLDTLDWKTRNAKKIFKKVKKEVKDGDIILMHDIHAETAEAIKEVVPWLQEQGYDVLTVSELAARNGKKLEAGKAYCDGAK